VLALSRPWFFLDWTWCSRPCAGHKLYLEAIFLAVTYGQTGGCDFIHLWDTPG